jgi:DNA-binding Lrp family transcriptional regulator
MHITVDEVDLAIIQALQRNPSETNKALAARVGMSDVGVSNRIRRLIENNVIRPTLFYDAESLGLSIYCVLEMCVRGRSVAEVARDIAEIDGLQTVITLIGTPELAALFFARDHAHVEAVRRFVAAVPGVHTLDVIMSTHLAKYLTAYGAYAMLDHDDER